MVDCLSKKFYFIGLTGVGMASIARVLVRFGYQVSGWDDNPDPKILKLLQNEGIELIHWDQVSVVESMVYSTAISKEHPGFIWAKNRELSIYHRSDILAWLSHRIPTIAVCGSHGKTTTTSMIHHVLTRLKIPHVVIVGGVLNGQVGGKADHDPQWLVIEACESDRTFLKYSADYVVLTNISQDHLEYYGNDINNLIDAFARWINSIKPKVLLPYAHERVNRVIEMLEVPCKTVGHGSPDYTFSYQAEGLYNNITISNSTHEACYKVAAPGSFNAANAAMVVAAIDMLGVNIWENPDILTDYVRVDRRFEYQLLKTRSNGHIHWISDYGHHPSEVAAVIDTVRALWPGLAVRMVFEPHRYTRTQSLFREFTEVLQRADELYLLPIYASAEPPIDGITSEALIVSMGSVKHRVTSASRLLHDIASWSDLEGIVLFQGAGTVHAHATEWLKLYDTA